LERGQPIAYAAAPLRREGVKQMAKKKDKKGKK
jgi:hypothetical protein